MTVCYPNLISTCAPDWEDSEVEDHCLAYTDKYYEKCDVYRNPYCAYCNRVDFNVTNICDIKFTGRSFHKLLKWRELQEDKQPLRIAEETHPDQQKATNNQDADEGKKTERCSFLVVPSVLQLHSDIT
jgi:hypothetical protein